MSRKIFDIIPPSQKKSYKKNQARDRKPAAKKVVIKPAPKREERVARKARGNFKFPFLKVFVGASVVVIVSVGAFGYSVLAKTKVIIWPEINELSFVFPVSVDSKAKATDFQNKTLLGKVFEENKDISKTFAATLKAQKEIKATGVIKVFNTFSGSAQVLVTSTRFVSAQGKLFRSLKKVVVPGTTLDNKGKIVPGSADVEVQSAEGGESYNIDPTTFSIPGFAGTPKYTSFYGISYSPMKGGLKGEVLQVSEKDLKDAEKALSDQARLESIADFGKIVPKDYSFINDAVFLEKTDSSSSKKAGDEGPDFTFNLKEKAKVIAFSKSDMEKLLKDEAAQNGAEGNIIKEGTLLADYSASSLDRDNLLLSLNVSAKADVYSDIDLDQLKKTILGLSFGEAKTFIKDSGKVQKIDIKSFPFWNNRFPQDPARVEVQMHLDR